MFKNISKYAWFSFVPYSILGIISIYMLIIGIIPIYYLITTFIMWILISGLGIAVGYHRIFSHNNYNNLARWKENIILFFGSLGGQGSSITWTAVHRGYHHKWSDTDRDFHSPIHGIYHAFFGWTTKITENSNHIKLKYAANLLKKSNHVWFHRHQLKITWLTTLFIMVIDWKLCFTIICLPIFISIIQDNLVNVLGHTRGLIGYRNFETADNSHNNLILGYITWGQGWHNNHHYDPKSYDFGKSISGKWWEWDPCNVFKWFLK